MSIPARAEGYDMPAQQHGDSTTVTFKVIGIIKAHTGGADRFRVRPLRTTGMGLTGRCLVAVPITVLTRPMSTL